MYFPQPHIYKSLFPNGYIKNYTFEGEMCNGYPTGDWKLYNSSGSMYAISKWDNGSLLKTLIFYTNGKLKMYFKFLGDTIIIKYCDSLYSSLAREVTFKDGHVVGVMKEFYPDGSIQSYGPCEKIYNEFDVWVGEFGKTGLWQYYNNEGILTHELTFKEGEIDGYCKYYNKDRTTFAEGRQIDDERVGLWRFYKEAGSIDDCQYLFTKYYGFAL